MVEEIFKQFKILREMIRAYDVAAEKDPEEFKARVRTWAEKLAERLGKAKPSQKGKKKDQGNEE